MLFCAIYRSDAVAETGADLIAIAHILGISDRNNRRDHITGLLIAHNRQFLQVIEGQRADIERLLKRLAADRRHRDMQLLCADPVAVRRFPDWSMACGPVTEALAEAMSASHPRFTADEALQMLAAAAARMSPQAA